MKYGSKVIGNSGRIIKGSYVIGNVVANNYQRYVVDKEKFSLAQLGVDALTITLEVFSIKGAAKGLKSSYSNLSAEFKPAYASFEGRIYRSVNSAYDPLDINQYTIDSNHRYTKPGTPGLYFSSGEKIVKAELGNYGVTDFSNRTMYSYDVELDNMLDVSNPAVRGKLGVSLNDLLTDDYRTNIGSARTHKIGDFAFKNGYNGIIAPSARADGGVNIIMFYSSKIK